MAILTSAFHFLPDPHQTLTLAFCPSLCPTVCVCIRCNRDAKQTLELDWSDKYQAYSLDDQCGRYNNMSTDTQYHPNSENLQDQ